MGVNANHKRFERDLARNNVIISPREHTTERVPLREVCGGNE